MKVTLIVATSSDGFISPADSVKLPSTTWTSEEDHDFFVKKTKEIGIMIMGRATYETIGRPLKGRISVVMTRDSEAQAEKARQKLKMDWLPNNLRFSSKTPREILQALTVEGYEQVALCGGASLYQLFMDEGLVDEMLITVEPVKFNEGIKLFKDESVFEQFKLIDKQELNQAGTVVEKWEKLD